MKLFRGSGVAIITPFIDQTIDYELFKKLIEFQIKNKTDALIIGGTTGESATLSYQEKLKLYQVAVETAKGRVLVIANTGTNNTSESIKLSFDAKNIGVDGLLLVTPYYNKPNQRGLYEHFKTIAEAVDLPIILYNVPSRTSVNLEAETTIRLSQIRNIVAVKEASGNLEQVKKIIQGTDENFAVYSGNDDLVYETNLLGGDGVISVVANLFPKESHDLFELFESNPNASKKLQERLNILNDVLYIEPNPVPIKALFHIMKINVGQPRLPLVSAENRTISILENALIQFGIKEVLL
jgi:4-hydroxy-tetrahydrodipicolinate synthase